MDFVFLLSECEDWFAAPYIQRWRAFNSYSRRTLCADPPEHPPPCADPPEHPPPCANPPEHLPVQKFCACKQQMKNRHAGSNADKVYPDVCLVPCPFSAQQASMQAAHEEPVFQQNGCASLILCVFLRS
eukprot:1151450-Pelagomonas_calceolata.AAC.2